MPRFAANLSTMFCELPFLDRFDAARRAGFDAVEVQEPYEYPALDVKNALQQAGLTLELINAPGEIGQMADGMGAAAVPGCERVVRDSIEQAIAYAMTVGAPRIHVMSGVKPDDVDLNTCFRTLAENLSAASTDAGRHNITLVIEPINTRDVPGYILSRQLQARAVVQQVAHNNVRIQFDFYHCQIMDGDLCHWFTQQLPWIGHVQFSNNPGRHEPGTGEINFAHVFDHIDAEGYNGPVGAEYNPAGETFSGLAWFEKYRVDRSC